MKPLITLVLSLFLAPLAYNPTVVSQENNVPDRVRAVRTIAGSLTHFQMGDYLHANFRTAKGRRLSLFVMKPGMEYFLAAHKARMLTLTYEIVDTYIPEAGGVNKIERLTSARAGGVSYESWWRSTRAKYPGEAAQRKYGKLVEKYTTK